MRRLIGVAPQELALYQTVTVRENLRLFGGLAGLHGRALDAAISRVLDELALGAVAGKLTGVLSGGQRRRVQAATAMVASPPLLLLDEPTAGADPETRSALLAAVRARAAGGTAVLYTTHYLPELTELNATLALVRAGRLIARGTQEELAGDRQTLDDLYWSLAVLVRHNLLLMKREPGPLLSRMILPVAFLTLLRPLYLAAWHGGVTGSQQAVIATLVTFSLLALSISGCSRCCSPGAAPCSASALCSACSSAA